MGSDGVHQRLGLPEPFEELPADDGMGALDLVVDRLPDVVQQARLPGERHVGPDLGCGHRAEERYLLAVG